MRDEYNASKVVANARRTVGEAIADYVAAREAQGFSKGTLDTNRWQLEVIGEALGARRTSTLTVADCDGFLEAAANGLRDRRPISRAHIGRIRFTLINVLANEIRVGHLSRNVAELSILPATTVTKKERRALSHDELAALLSVAKGSRLVLIDLSARNGLRPAEARALRWVDVDLEVGVLTVSGQLDRQNRLTKPKTKKSTRSLQLDEVTISRLRVWQEEQAVQLERARNAWEDLDIVATTARGNPVDRHSFAKSLKRLCAEIGIEPISPYELRHTAITMQADSGHSSWEIADWAGTSEAMISEVYRHRLRRVAGLRPARS
jgi:integrase